MNLKAFTSSCLLRQTIPLSSFLFLSLFSSFARFTQLSAEYLFESSLLISLRDFSTRIQCSAVDVTERM